MQQVTRALPRRTKIQPERPLEQQDKIDLALLQMATRVGRTLSVDRINQWHQDLAPYPVAAIEWVMDSWGRNSSKLPALADLRGLLGTWAAENVKTEYCGQCNSGWLLGYKDKAGNPAAKRCECCSTPA